MNIQELKAKFQSVSITNASIKSFLFDELPAVNTNRQKSYPLLLMKTPTTIDSEPFNTGTTQLQYDNYNITLYYLKPWTKEDKKTKPLEEIYKDCISEFDTYLREFLALGTNVYYLSGNKRVSKTLGHHQHVDQLVGLSATFTLKVFNC